MHEMPLNFFFSFLSSRFDFICAPLANPKFKREFDKYAPARPGAFTRSDLLLPGSGMPYPLNKNRLPDMQVYPHLAGKLACARSYTLL